MKIICALVLFFSGCLAFQQPFIHNNVKADNTSFDYFVFNQMWQPSTNTSDFTIHGMWPQRYDGSYPSFCNGATFSTKVIADLIPTMNIVWPSGEQSNSVFWDHEWTKHGTCSLIPMHTFFADAIQQNEMWDLMAALKKSGITPGGTYPSKSLLSAIKANLGYVPALHCVNNALVEIAMCIDKNLAPQDCSADVSEYFTCPTSLSFPSS